MLMAVVYLHIQNVYMDFRIIKLWAKAGPGVPGSHAIINSTYDNVQLTPERRKSPGQCSTANDKT